MFGKPINGNKVGTTTLKVAVPKVISEVDVRVDGSDFVLVKNRVIGRGASIDEAVKAFKAAWKSQKQ